MRCVHCHTTETPLWRAGPAGPKTLQRVRRALEEDGLARGALQARPPARRRLAPQARAHQPRRRQRQPPPRRARRRRVIGRARGRARAAAARRAAPRVGVPHGGRDARALRLHLLGADGGAPQGAAGAAAAPPARGGRGGAAGRHGRGRAVAHAVRQPAAAGRGQQRVRAAGVCDGGARAQPEPEPAAHPARAARVARRRLPAVPVGAGRRAQRVGRAHVVSARGRAL
ncbi:hypothetical protein FGB62_62g148 [Gracilaria domingensis]|nr:hypothetical protein FGB62_62g148 [Gracilaria domingensis]